MEEKEFIKAMSEKINSGVNENIRELESVLGRRLTKSELTYYEYGFNKGLTVVWTSMQEMLRTISKGDETK